MELSTTWLRTSLNFIKSITPVDTEKTERRHKDPRPYTSRPFQIEWIEFLVATPVISPLSKAKNENGCLRIKRNRITKFKYIFVIHNPATRCWPALLRNSNHLLILITAQTDNILIS